MSSDISDRFGNRYGCQTMAVGEGFVANGKDGVGNCYGRHIAAAVEGTVCQGGNRVRDGIINYFRWNYNIA